MRVLFLCDAKHCKTKMSRGRFLYVEAIGVLVPTHTWGNGHVGYRPELSVTANLKRRKLKYDAVFAYMPEDHIGFADVDAVRVIDINEMYNEAQMKPVFEVHKPHLALCHHANEMARFVDRYPATKFVHIPHCSDPRIFKPYGKKKIDALLIGQTCMEFYPLRTRMMAQVIPKLQELGFKAEVWKHPGYVVADADSNATAIAYAKRISEARIALFCSGTAKTRYAKYNETAFCGTAIGADIPDEDQDFFREFVLELTDDMSTDEIVAKIADALRDPEALQARADLGRERNKHLTTSYYAKRAVAEIENIMREQ